MLGEKRIRRFIIAEVRKEVKKEMLNRRKFKVYKEFKSEEFGLQRTVRDDENHIFYCGEDVTRALGFKDSQEALRKYCEEDVVDICVPYCDRVKSMSFITKGGLCSLILKSEHPDKQVYESWVFNEIRFPSEEDISIVKRKESEETCNTLDTDDIKEANWDEVLALRKREQALIKRIEELEKLNKSQAALIEKFMEEKRAKSC